LKILSINVQSLADINHVTILRHYLANEIVDIAGISETWLKSKHDNPKMFEIDGYELLRHDRPETRGGGVAFYIRKGLAFEIICKSQNGEQEGAEYLMIHIKAKQVKLLMCIVYRRPHNDVTFTNLFADLKDHYPHYDQCVVMGDFNCNFKNESVLLRSLNFEVEEMGFERLPIEDTHLSYNNRRDFLFTRIQSNKLWKI
jgi:exonuclease III